MTFLEGIILITGALACFKFGRWFEQARAELPPDDHQIVPDDPSRPGDAT